MQALINTCLYKHSKSSKGYTPKFYQQLSLRNQPGKEREVYISIILVTKTSISYNTTKDQCLKFFSHLNLTGISCFLLILLPSNYIISVNSIFLFPFIPRNNFLLRISDAGREGILEVSLRGSTLSAGAITKETPLSTAGELEYLQESSKS